MTVFVSGGAKYGKSSFAQELAVKLVNGKKHYYVATMIPADAEDRERIRKHLDDRMGLALRPSSAGGISFPAWIRPKRTQPFCWTALRPC